MFRSASPAALAGAAPSVRTRTGTSSSDKAMTHTSGLSDRVTVKSPDKKIASH
jgi:hypothetical protein